MHLLVVVSMILVAAGCGELEQQDPADGGIDGAQADGSGGTCTGCASTASCVDDACVCDPGYSGDGETCENIDECATDHGGCDANARCDDLPGSRACSCNVGYLGDGLTCRLAWQHVTTLPGIVLDEGSGAVVTALASRIYFAPEHDPAGTYFMSVDVNTGATAELPLPPLINVSQRELVPGGYTQIFVGLGSSIYMFGNAGALFDGSWREANYPSINRRGEAAGVAASGRIYMIGGRDDATNASTTSVQYYAGGTTGSWAAASPFPWTSSYAGAYSPTGTNLIYVFGGSSGDNSDRHAASLDTTSSSATWTILPDVPVDLPRFSTAGEHGGKLFACDGQRLHFFDRGANAWAGTLNLPPGGTHWHMVMLEGDAFAIGDLAGSVQIFQLLAIE